MTTLKSSSVKEETESTVEKLANLEMVKATSELLHHFPKQIREAGQSAMMSTAVDDFSMFASRHSGRYFSDDFLNDLVSTAKLGCLFSGNYFNPDERNPKLMQLLYKGTELTAVLVNISEKINSLLEPYLPVEREVLGLDVKGLIERFESMGVNTNRIF